MNPAIRLCAVTALVLAAGCNSLGQEGPGASATGDPAAQGGEEVVAEAVAATQFASHALEDQHAIPGGGQATGAGYRLNPSDVIEVHVFQVEELSRTAPISSDGTISLPLIGSVQAAGRTTDELADEIARKLGEDYLQQPQVSVFVEDYRSQRVTVDGAVNSPGVYEITPGSGLVQSIALAGGVERVGDTGGVMVFRMVDGERHAAAFDLAAIRRGEEPDPTIRGGDVIVVDESAAGVAWRTIREASGVATRWRPWAF